MAIGKEKSMLPNTQLSIWGIFKASLQGWTKVFLPVQGLALVAFLWGALPYFFIPELKAYQYNGVLVKVLDQAVATVIYLLGLLIFYAAVYHRTDKVLIEQKSSFWESILFGLKRLWLLVLAMIISAVALILGYAALVIPGIFLTVTLSFYYPMIVTEDKNAWEAFKACFQLIKGHWWRTAAVIIIPSIMVSIITAIIEFSLVKFYVALHPDSGIIALYPHLVRWILGAIYFPFIATLILIQLNDLKIRKGWITLLK